MFPVLSDLMVSGNISFSALFAPLVSPAFSGSDYGSAAQDGFAYGLQRRNILLQRVPHSLHVNSTIGMNIEVSSILDYTPRNRCVLLLYQRVEQPIHRFAPRTYNRHPERDGRFQTQ